MVLLVFATTRCVRGCLHIDHLLLVVPVLGSIVVYEHEFALWSLQGCIVSCVVVDILITPASNSLLFNEPSTDTVLISSSVVILVLRVSVSICCSLSGRVVLASFSSMRLRYFWVDYWALFRDGCSRGACYPCGSTRPFG